MATKAKTSGTPSSAPVQGPEAALAEALKLFHDGKADAAKASFEALLDQAREQGHLGCERTAQIHLKALESRIGKAKAVSPEAALDAQILLNRHEAEAALPILDAALAKSGDRAQLHFLKAIALAQLDQAEGAAASLSQAVELDGGFLHLFHLEPDFDGVRQSAPFARF